MIRFLFFALLVILGLFAWLAWRGDLVVPPEWNPWAPLDIQAEPNLLTPFKLRKVRGDPGLCRAALLTSDFDFVPAPDRSSDTGCGVSNAVEVTESMLKFNAPFTATCPVAVALAMTERHVILPAAREILGTEVTALDHFGTYSCRNINHSASRRRSQHATANAIDIAAFRMADGRMISLTSGWDGDTDASRFLRRVRDGACRFFKVVLSPDYNAAHRDHFHFDMGPYSTCR
ncbi:hypothetical protein FHS85_004719 [Rhodoligotrophos appendicifer]|uniref:extensin-like domain-containing protein n=1 Tax=Rhodoligotrophos appendicifer TaxID=987056 RepID=UPI001FEABC4D|nr:extensin family protein [Rhodoligotrophos appendicifer]